jgi:tRNA(Ile)-lysidine synthase
MPTLQDLPKPLAKRVLALAAFVQQELGVELRDKKVLVALSGGIDSTALLIVLLLLKDKLGCTLSAAHLHHGLRKEADAEAEHVEKLCSWLGVGLAMRKVDVQAVAADDNIGIEEAGRHLRYAFLMETAEGMGADWIALGHHLDDLAEDQMMRMIRGTGWPGLGGMPAVDEERKILRPFLATPKALLVELCTALGVGWCEDASNTDPAFFRNRVRSELMPFMRKENPAHLDAALALWRMARRDEAHFEAAIEAHCPHDFTLPHTLDDASLRGLSSALRLRLFKHILDRMGPGQALSDALFALDAAYLEKRSGKTFQFPGDKRVQIRPEGLLFSCKGESEA